MNYYKLWLALDDDDALMAAGPSLKPPFTNWLRGVAWSQPVPQPVDVEVTKPGRMLPYYNVPLPLMTPAMLTTLRATGVSNLEDYAARIHDPVSGTTWSHYRAVNVIGVIAAVDRERSEGDALDPSSDLGTFFDRVVIDPVKARGELMFRLADNLSYLVVAESVKEALQGMADVRGLRFTPLNGEDEDDGDEDDDDEDETGQDDED